MKKILLLLAVGGAIAALVIRRRQAAAAEAALWDEATGTPPTAPGYPGPSRGSRFRPSLLGRMMVSVPRSLAEPDRQGT